MQSQDISILVALNQQEDVDLETATSNLSVLSKINAYVHRNIVFDRLKMLIQKLEGRLLIGNTHFDNSLCFITETCQKIPIRSPVFLVLFRAVHVSMESIAQTTRTWALKRLWLLWLCWTEPQLLDVAMITPGLFALQAIQRVENKRKMEFGGERSSWKFHVLALDWFQHELKLTSSFCLVPQPLSLPLNHHHFVL